MKILLVLLIAFGLNSVTYGADEVGNGGDHIRMIFKEAKKDAVSRVSSVHSVIDSMETSSTTKVWLKKNYVSLLDDLKESRLVWVENLPAFCPVNRCACTKTGRKSDIFLSFSKCSNRSIGLSDAGKLILHEVAHHLDVKDEDLADEIAMSIYRISNSKQYLVVGMPEKAEVNFEVKENAMTNFKKVKYAVYLNYLRVTSGYAQNSDRWRVMFSKKVNSSIEVGALIGKSEYFRDFGVPIESDGEEVFSAGTMFVSEHNIGAFVKLSQGETRHSPFLTVDGVYSSKSGDNSMWGPKSGLGMVFQNGYQTQLTVGYGLRIKGLLNFESGAFTRYSDTPNSRQNGIVAGCGFLL